MTDNTQTTLRDTISQAFDTVEKNEPEIKQTVTETPAEKVEVTASDAKPRNEHGRFIKPEAKTEPLAEKPKLQRPSSWKKDYWGHWDKLTTGQALSSEEAMQLAEYAAQREQDFAKGVSTYKTEWDRARPIVESINSLQPIFQQYGTDAGRWINDVGNYYRALTTGNNQQRIGTLFQMAQQFQIPLEEIFDQGEDGRWYLNTQKIQSTQPRAPQAADVRQVVQQMLQEEHANEQVKTFIEQREKYPYLEQVRETMAGLLHAGLVEDLQTAYMTAIKMPQHAELYQEHERLQREADEQTKREQAVKAAQQARSKAVSPRSSTPVGTMKTETGKGIRSALEDAFNERVGRV